MNELLVRPVGFVRSPFREKVEAPRQGTAGGGAGEVELYAGFEDALEDLAGFERIWILFWFHHAESWRSKVLPPRSERKRGVFATRSPHRPNPIGMTAVRLLGIEGRVVRVDGLDLVEGTPVLDLKPYLPYADAFVESKTGWVEGKDDRPGWSVAFSALADEQLAWVERETALALRPRIEQALSLGPQPHAYRRIKVRDDGARVLAVKEWRVRFVVDDAAHALFVERLDSGYRERDLERGTSAVHASHRAYVTTFGRG